MALRVGIVGYGEAGRLHATHLTRAGARVVGVVTRRNGDCRLPRYSSLESLLPHVDAITVAVPNHLHASICREAVAAGKAVLVEKPLALYECELDELEDALARTPVPLKVGFRLRWNPELRRLRRKLRSPRRIRCIYRLGIEALAAGKPWTRKETESGGAFFTLGVHAFDLVRWLARCRGEPLEELRASSWHREASADFPLVVEVSGRLPSGIRCIAGAELRDDVPFRLELEIDSRRVETSPDERGVADEEYGAMIADFINCARSAQVDSREQAELFRVHRDLVHARSLAESSVR